MSMLRLVTGIAGKSGFGSASTAEDVTHRIDAANLTAIITGLIFISLSFNLLYFNSYWGGLGQTVVNLKISKTIFHQTLYVRSTPTRNVSTCRT